MMLSPSATLLAHIDIPPRLLGSLIVLGICLVIWFFKAILSTDTKASQTAGPSCPTCGGKASWATPQNYWNCFRCNRPVPMPGQQPMGQQPMGGPPPGQNPYGAPPPQQNPYAQQPQPPVPQQAAQVPFCGTCGGPGRWLPESNAWGCDRCRQLIQPR
jgi:ribosomal protein L37AE/L43A